MVEANGFLSIADQIARGGVVAALLLVLLGGHYGFWVYGRTAMKRERELEERITYLEQKVEWWEQFGLNLLQTTNKVVEDKTETTLRQGRR